MSDSNNNRKSAVRQTNASNNGPDYFGSSRAHIGMAGHYAAQGFVKSAGKYTENVSITGPSRGVSGAVEVGTAVAAGGKEWAQAAKHGAYGAASWSKGAINGFNNYANQGRNANVSYNMMKINQSIAQGRANANQIRQNSGYTLKASKTNQLKTAQSKATMPKQVNTNVARTNSYVNRGINNFQNKSYGKASIASKSSSANRGISNFQGKAGNVSKGSSPNKGISSFQSKSAGQVSSSVSKGSSSGSGSSKGGQSR